MNLSRVKRSAASSLAVAGLFVAILAGPASAAADREVFVLEGTEVYPVVGIDCVNDQVAGTETFSFDVVANIVLTESGQHVAAGQTFEVHALYENGYEVTGTGHSTLSLQIAGGTGEVTFAFVVYEVHNIYDADGNLVTRATYHDISHLNYRDANGNGEPDEGEMKVDLHRFLTDCL